MNLQEFLELNLLDVFSNTITTRQNARILLESVQFPRGSVPPFRRDNPRQFWLEVCENIDAGILESGTDLQILVDAAARRYPSNSALREASSNGSGQQSAPSESDKVDKATTDEEAGEGTTSDLEGSDDSTSAEQVEGPTSPAPTPPRYITLSVRGWDDVPNLIDAARAAAQELGMNPDSVDLLMFNAEGIILSLEGQDMEFAARLGELIRQNAPEGSIVSTSAAASEFRDYLIRQLFVEGPDQQRFELNDVQASTLVRDIAQGVMGSEYYDAEDSSEALAKREVVVDRQNQDGSTERLDPDKTLHDSKVGEGEVLSVSPEASAGAVNPVIREAALKKACDEVLEFAETHPGFEVDANSPHAPTEYVLYFRAPSFGPPPRVSEDPTEIDEHEVYVFLPGDFPMKAPQVLWRSPIFHPNIDPKSGLVCLGALGDHYRPGLSFELLCQLIVDIAAWRNVAADNGYNTEAQKWALAFENQEKVERRGGKSVLRMLYHANHKPRRLWIRKIDAPPDLSVDAEPTP